MTNEIVLTRGLPASGKTTWAEALVKSNQNYRNVNRDDLRFMLFGRGYTFSKERENQITDIQQEIARDLISEGFSVIISDTNLNPSVVKRWKETANYWQVPFRIEDFTDVPLHVCLERDLQRERTVGKKVINRMYRQYIEPEIKPYEGTPNKPKAYVFDIDGTLAKMTTRGPFDWSRVGEDEVIPQTLNFMDVLEAACEYIILLSGRDECCRKETEDWLEEHGIPYDALFMRPEGSFEKDYIVKDELFTKYVEPCYNVQAVIDDRPQVCRMWRQKGLFVFNVGNPDLDF